MKRRSGGIGFCRRSEPGFERQIGTNQRFDLRPDGGIALDLDVRLHERTIPPGVLPASEWLRFVIEAEIAEDASAGGISGVNFGQAVEEAVKLVEIHRLGDVRRNYRIVLAEFGDTIDLDREEDWDAVLSKLARELDRLRGAPTVAEDNDAGVLLLLGRQIAVAIDVQETKHFLQRGFAMVIFESLSEDSGREFFFQAVDELYFHVYAIIVAHESAYETDHDDRRGGRNACGSSGRIRASLRGDENQSKNQERDSERGTHALHRDGKLHQYR
jgi:hypothetical protein